MEGMAEYGSGSIDQAVGNLVVRDAVAHNQVPHLPELHGFAHLKPNQVTLGYKTGEAAMEFLADEYGHERIHDLLVLMKDHFDISTALDQMLGTDIYRFDDRFHEWLKDKYMRLLAHAQEPEAYGSQYTFIKDNIPQFNQAPVFSPDGKTIYFFSDRVGHTVLCSVNVETKKTRQLTTLDWGRFENLQTHGRALSITADGRWIAFAGEKKQRDKLYIYDTKKRRVTPFKIPFDEIRSPVFSPEGESLICVGMTRGYNDLYRIDRRGNLLERLTDNPQDERDPVFSKDGKSIIYSGETVDAANQPHGRDLFRLTLDGKKIEQLTDYEGEETEPDVSADGTLYFVRDREKSDAPGFNLYRLNLQSGELNRLTDMKGGAFSPRLTPDESKLYYVAFNAGSRNIYSYDNLQSTAIVTSVVTEKRASIDGVGEPDDWTTAPKKDASFSPVSLRRWSDDSTSPLVLGPPFL
jgi:Tol biopolymer transport system component